MWIDLSCDVVFYGIFFFDDECFVFFDCVYVIGCIYWDLVVLYGDSEVLFGKWFEKIGKRKDVSVVVLIVLINLDLLVYYEK